MPQFQYVSLLTTASSSANPNAGAFSYLGVLNPEYGVISAYASSNTLGTSSSVLAASALTIVFRGSISGGFSNGSLIISH